MIGRTKRERGSYMVDKMEIRMLFWTMGVFPSLPRKANLGRILVVNLVPFKAWEERWSPCSSRISPELQFPEVSPVVERRPRKLESWEAAIVFEPI